MKHALIAALLIQSLAYAQTADDEDDAPAPAAAPAAPAPAPALGAVTANPSASVADEQKLINGAPLDNPNVAVHIVEKKAVSDSKRFEVVLYPAVVQVNGKFNQHYGTNLSALFHLQENFAFMLTGYYNWVSEESAFNAELIEKPSSQAQAATSLLNTWGALAGVEVTPFYGKFVWFENNLVHFSMVLSGGAGIGGTRHTIKPGQNIADPNNPSQTVYSPATYGDTGPRFMGSLGAGFRVGVGEHFAVRLEVRDVIYTAKVDQVNGCSGSDLAAMTVNGAKPSTVRVGEGCAKDKFADGDKFTTEAFLANTLVKNASSDVLNNLGLYLGVSFLF